MMLVKNLEKEKYNIDGKKNLLIRWFDYEKICNLLVEKIIPVFEEIYNKNISNIKQELKEGNKNMFNNI